MGTRLPSIYSTEGWEPDYPVYYRRSGNQTRLQLLNPMHQVPMNPLVTSVHLMRPGIGKNVTCTVDDDFA